MKHYIIKTYGCQMNIHDSEKIAGMLESLGYSETNDSNIADVVVFNTCCIRDGVEQKISAHIGAFKNIKKKNPSQIIIVCGCFSQEQDKAKYLKSKFPFIDIIVGTHNIHKIKDLLIEYLNDKKKQIDVWEEHRGIFENVEMFRTSGKNAWVNISYGCNNFCSYCIVPYVRGRERSRNMIDIINEVKELINEGYKYITLLGQNVNSYGNDIDDENVNFANLLKELSKLEGGFRIKFLTSHPKDLTSELIDTIASNNKISKSIHLPVQSGSNRILKLMNRRYTREKYISIIDEIKNKIPNATLSTDIIVGFPDESDDDFNDTLSLIEYVKYDGVFAFMYSIRTGTVAATMENQIDESIKNIRVNKVLQLAKSISKENKKNMLGKVFEAFITDITESVGYATLDSGINVELKFNEKLTKSLVNNFANVKIISVSNNKYVAEVV